MTEYGYFLASEEFPPGELVRQARLAELAGFTRLAISDHFHPWTAEQGSSPFVWSTIGALSQVTDLPVTTLVTCPTVRMHPAVTAQAAATSAVLLGGRFRLGVGTGEALNEHILGDRWPPFPVRAAMLEEAVDVMRRLFGGGRVTHHGDHYTVENARLYTVPDDPVPVYVSAFGTAAAELAGRIGDGLVTTTPDSEIVTAFREAGGAGKPLLAGTKVCWGADKDACVRTAHRLWASELLPGELAQLLPDPRHFEQAAELTGPDLAAEAFVCGPDAAEHAARLRRYADEGFDEVYVGQIGPDQDAFFLAYAEHVLPALR